MATAVRGTETLAAPAPAAVAVAAQRLLLRLALAMEAITSGSDIFNDGQQEIIKQFGRIKSETVPENKDAGSDDDDDDDEDEDDETGDADDDDADAVEEFSGEEGEDDDDDDPEANGEDAGAGSDDDDGEDDDGDDDDGEDDDDDDEDDEDEEEELTSPESPRDLLEDSQPPTAMSKVLPKHVCFKGDNGKYLSARKVEWGLHYLQFSSDDISDPTVRNIIYPNSDGTIRIYSCYYGKFWRRSPNWIWGDSDDTTSRNPDTVFRAVLLGDGKCALQNLGNNNFCKRLTTEGKTSCLNAAVSTITREAQLELHETVFSRRIYGVEYRLQHANIHDLKPRTFYTKTVGNSTGRLQKSKLTISYKVTTEKKWDSNVSMKLGVRTTFTAGVPEITQGSVEVSSEFSSSYTWGATLSHEETYSDEEKIEVPAHTHVTVRVVATQGICDIPFSYYQEDILTTGEKVVTMMNDGIYRGLNSYGFETEIIDA